MSAWVREHSPKLLYEVHTFSSEGDSPGQTRPILAVSLADAQRQAARCLLEEAELARMHMLSVLIGQPTRLSLRHTPQSKQPDQDAVIPTSAQVLFVAEFAGLTSRQRGIVQAFVAGMQAARPEQESREEKGDSDLFSGG
ncbi:MAG TPA: hypothetical protein VFV38_39825 [Ktedonobacteraceae bacterium]|nr:hypothetical protein [Ktedonobacteraceae bacterium]